MPPRKQKKYSNDLREFALKHYLSAESLREIVKVMLIPCTSVHCIIAKLKSTKCIRNMIGRGLKRKVTTLVGRCIRHKIMVNPQISSSAIKSELQSEVDIAISETAIKRTGSEPGLFGRTAKKKPYFSTLNQTK